MSAEERQPANMDAAMIERAREFEGLLRAALIAAVRLALIRHNIELEPDTATEEEIAADAAGACFGEETCSDEPIQEIAKLRAFASSIQAEARQERYEQQQNKTPFIPPASASGQDQIAAGQSSSESAQPAASTRSKRFA